MSIYTEEQVTENALEYFKNDTLAATIWVKKYNLKDNENNHVESDPKERFRTITQEIIRVDSKYNDSVRLDPDDVYNALRDQLFLPGGSALFGIGNKYSIVSLGNCFVISGNNQDSYGSIMKNDQEIVQIAKRRGGVGFDISHLRPSGWNVKNAAGSSSGATSFASRFSHSTREVGQAGRRGALMLSIHVNHPDVMKFITMKDNDTEVTGANVSVKLTDEFMQAVISDGMHQLRYPVTAPRLNTEMVPGEVYNTSGATYMSVKARDIFNRLAEVNWRRAEPGVLFWDTITQESPADQYPEYKSESTNPCGEIPLSPYDSCRLLALSLTSYVNNPFSINARFNWIKFKKAVTMVTRIMDNIIDLEIEKIEAIIAKIISDPESDDVKATELNLWANVLKTTINGRRAGISLIGHGDMFAMLGIKYGNNESVQLAELLHETHAKHTYQESIRLAKVRGEFPSFDKGLDGGDFLKRIGVDGIPRRNIALLTIPPSGSLSILFNNQSSGIEPVFAPWYSRRRKVSDSEESDFKDKTGDRWQTYHVFHNNFIKWAESQNITLEELEQNKEEYLKKSPYHNSTSHFVDPLQKVKLQGAIQQYVDHSISMTSNLPKDATVEDIKKIYITAWENKCKGATVYRDGSRSGVLNVEEEKVELFKQNNAPKRPKELPCDIFHASIAGDKYIVMVGIMEDKPYEVFAIKRYAECIVSNTTTKGILKKQKSKHWQLLTTEGEVLIDNITEEFDIPEYGTVTKLASLSLRTGAGINYVMKVLNNNNGIITDYSKVIARQLKKYATSEEDSNAKCPECGQTMRVEGGCKMCMNEECGYGACG